jgi:UbiD family decarboxylase
MSTAIGASVANATARSNLEPRLCYDDLRQWLEEARKLGEVKELSGLTWQQDIGMVASTAAHDDGAPCFVFEEVPGTIKGSRVLVNFFGGKRKNMTLGFATDLSKIDLSEGFRTNFIGPMRRIAPKYVDDGPIFENVITGDDVDVTAFPAPKWHAADGGRYIGTGSFNVTRDPDEGWVNCGTYRVMIHDAKTAGFYISPGKHGRQMRDKYQARRAPMPVAVVCGGDPMTFLMASSEVPYGVSEYEVVGGVRGKPVEVINGPVTGLPIPANAEIVLEGFVEPGNERVEGPFGEWTGYYASDLRPEPVLDIKAVYYRNNPILLGCVPQRPPDEICRYRARGSLGAVAREYREGGRARGDGGLGARGRQCAAPARCRRQPALSRPCQAGRPHRGHVPRRRLFRPLCDRGRRRHRRVQSRRAGLGPTHALRSRHLDRHHPQRLVDAARSAHRARAQGGRRPHQQPGGHRCLPALALARQVPQGERAHAGRAPHGAGEVRPPVQQLIGRCA